MMVMFAFGVFMFTVFVFYFAIGVASGFMFTNVVLRVSRFILAMVPVVVVPVVMMVMCVCTSSVLVMRTTVLGVYTMLASTLCVMGTAWSSFAMLASHTRYRCLQLLVIFAFRGLVI